MNVGPLIAKEIGHRRISFGLAILSVAVAVLVAELSLLERLDRKIGQIIAARRRETQVYLSILLNSITVTLQKMNRR